MNSKYVFQNYKIKNNSNPKYVLGWNENFRKNYMTEEKLATALRPGRTHLLPCHVILRKFSFQP